MYGAYILGAYILGACIHGACNLGAGRLPGHAGPSLTRVSDTE